MVVLTKDLIVRSATAYNKKRTDESVGEYQRRLTHLYCQEKNIDEVGDISNCTNLCVVYLYDNRLTSIPNFAMAKHLTHLYLQNNQIISISNITILKTLQKLYLGGNHLIILEGFDTPCGLKELHIENQNLPPGEKLIFDPVSIQNLSYSLEVLNVSGNRLESVVDLKPLVNLEQLELANNRLISFKELWGMLSGMMRLRKLNASGNPICTRNKYRERMIVSLPRIDVLDEKEIPQTLRHFLTQWKASKEVQYNRTRRGLPQTEYDGLGQKRLPPLSENANPALPAIPRKRYEEILERANLRRTRTDLI